jgi:hypothetical protein
LVAPSKARPGGGKEENEKDTVLAFDAMQSRFELREGAYVHDRKYFKQLVSKVFEK